MWSASNEEDAFPFISVSFGLVITEKTSQSSETASICLIMALLVSRSRYGVKSGRVPGRGRDI